MALRNGLDDTLAPPQFLAAGFGRGGRGGDEGLARTQSHPAGRRKGPFYKSFAGSGPTGLPHPAEIRKGPFFMAFAGPGPNRFLVVKHIQSSIYGSVRPFLPRGVFPQVLN